MTVYPGRRTPAPLRPGLRLRMRPTLRLRLTLLNGILLVGAGAVLVLLTSLLVDDALHPAEDLRPGTTARMRRMYRPGGRYPNHPFPDPDVVVGGRPAWYWRTASTWRAHMPRNMDGDGAWRRATRDDDTEGEQA